MPLEPPAPIAPPAPVVDDTGPLDVDALVAAGPVSVGPIERRVSVGLLQAAKLATSQLAPKTLRVRTAASFDVGWDCRYV
jgi:hypothetical protein